MKTLKSMSTVELKLIVIQLRRQVNKLIREKEACSQLSERLISARQPLPTKISQCRNILQPGTHYQNRSTSSDVKEAVEGVIGKRNDDQRSN